MEYLKVILIDDSSINLTVNKYLHFTDVAICASAQAKV